MYEIMHKLAYENANLNKNGKAKETIRCGEGLLMSNSHSAYINRYAMKQR